MQGFSYDRLTWLDKPGSATLHMDIIKRPIACGGRRSLQIARKGNNNP
jgi:hypothetical protein